MNKPLYREELLDHYRHPRNYGKLIDAQAAAEVDNPSCGDRIALQIQVEDGILIGIAFEGKGCVISQASASMMTEHIVRLSLEELKSFTQENMRSLLKIELGPTRMRCALLSLETLHKAIERYLQGTKDA
jgi:nitrogen fixation NifU-like protein